MRAPLAAARDCCRRCVVTINADMVAALHRSFAVPETGPRFKGHSCRHSLHASMLLIAQHVCRPLCVILVCPFRLCSRYWMIPPAYVHPAPIPRVRSWTQRQYDVLIYAKFADLDRRACVQGLQDALKRHNISFLRLEYGSYDKATLLDGANNARIAVLASWYDCGVSRILGGWMISAPKPLRPTTTMSVNFACHLISRHGFRASCLVRGAGHGDARAFIIASLAGMQGGSRVDRNR